MKKAYVDIPEGQIHYRIEGSGEPVLLLHAAVTSSDEYTRVIPFLAKTYCAIAMDFLGNGILTLLLTGIRYPIMLGL